MSHSFLQSQTWEQFQNSVGFQTQRLYGILVIEKKLPFGKKYWYIPRPNIKYQISNIKTFLDAIIIKAKAEKIFFIRLEPLETLPFNLLYPIKKVADVQPSQTVILDISQSEEKILKNMHPKTRYNIRLAEKKGVAIRQTDESELDEFWKLMKKTTERDKFRPHDKEYYEKMIKVNSDDLKIKLFFAEYEGEVLAAGIFSFHDETVTYIHGASSNENRNVMAPFLLHWRIITIAKELGFKFYDFYGISEKKWPGVTRFKRGFDGKEVNYPGTFDVVLNNYWYWLYTMLRKLKRIF